jgi:hypothetical protein
MPPSGQMVSLHSIWLFVNWSVARSMTGLGQFRKFGATPENVRYAQKSGLYSAERFRSGPSQ